MSVHFGGGSAETLLTDGVIIGGGLVEPGRIRFHGVCSGPDGGRVDH